MEFIDVNIIGTNKDYIINIPKYIKGEYVYSYLGRLANANGYMNTLEFLSMFFDKKRPFSSHIIPFFLRTFELDGISLLDGALISNTLFPFLSEKYHEFIYSFYEVDNGHRKIFNYKPMKLCPECYKEEMNHGLFYYHTYHQLPGVNCCAKHGCSLLEYTGPVGEEFHYPRFIENIENVKDIKTSRFLENMTNNPIVISRSETAFAIRKRIIEIWNPSSYEDVIYNLHSITGVGIEYFNECKIKDLMVAKDDTFNDIPLLSIVLSHIFEDYNEFKKYALEYRSVYQVFIETMIANLFQVDSWNRDGSITLKCMECGRQFKICPSLLLSGYGCTFCGKALNTRYQSERIACIDYALLNMADISKEYKILEIKNCHIRVLHKPSGRVVTENALFMLANHCITNSYDVREITLGNMESYYVESRKELELKLYDTNNRRIGIPVCDTLLSDIGILPEAPVRPAIALFNGKYINEHYLRIYKNKEHDVFFMKGEIDSDFWLPKAYILTLRFSSYCTNWNLDRAYELAYWMKQNGVTTELLRDTSLYMFDSTYASYGATLIDEV